MVNKVTLFQSPNHLSNSTTPPLKTEFSEAFVSGGNSGCEIDADGNPAAVHQWVPHQALKVEGRLPGGGDSDDSDSSDSETEAEYRAREARAEADRKAKEVEEERKRLEKKNQ